MINKLITGLLLVLFCLRSQAGAINEVDIQVQKKAQERCVRELLNQCINKCQSNNDPHCQQTCEENVKHECRQAGE